MVKKHKEHHIQIKKKKKKKLGLLERDLQVATNKTIKKVILKEVFSIVFSIIMFESLW
jgi:hypothetical protein